MSFQNRLAASIVYLLMTGCSVSSQGPSGPPGSLALPAGHLTSQKTGLKSSVVRSHREENQYCAAKGGTWTIPNLGTKNKRLVGGSLQYGPNGCSPRQKVLVDSLNYGGGMCPDLSGYTMSPFTIEFDNNDGGPWTFGGGGLLASVKSDSFDPSTSYTLLFFGNGSLLEQNVGEPSDGTLVFSSPFEGGMNWPFLDGALYIIFCYPST